MGFCITDLMTKTSMEAMHDNAEARLQNATFRDIRANIESKIKLMARNMVQIGYYLKLLRDRELYKEAGYDDFLECAYKEFNLTESSVYRFIRANSEYSSGGNSPEIDAEYSAYNSSQLIEMLNMPKEERMEITPDMPVKAIRRLKKKSQDDDLSKSGEREKDLPDEVHKADDVTAVDAADGYVNAEEKQETLPAMGAALQSVACPDVDEYMTWQVWLDIRETGERYYRLKPDGDTAAAVVVKDYLYHRKNADGSEEEVRGRAEYYLLKPHRTLKDCEGSREEVIKYLTAVYGSQST